MGLVVKNLEIMIRFVYLVVVVVVNLSTRSGFRFVFLGCNFVIWHSQIQVMEFAVYFLFFNSVCVVVVVFPVRKSVAWKVDEISD